MFFVAAVAVAVDVSKKRRKKEVKTADFFLPFDINFNCRFLSTSKKRHLTYWNTTMMVNSEQNSEMKMFRFGTAAEEEAKDIKTNNKTFMQIYWQSL